MSDSAVLSATADTLRAEMVDRVFADESVASRSARVAPWRAAFAGVARHLFIPPTVYVRDGGRPQFAPLRREDDPQRWLRLAYGGEGREGFVITQVDDGAPAGPDGRGRAPTSSASGPIIMAIMLAALDAQPGERVLEIGTGTGYNAALLAHRLGAEQVTSVELDPVLAERARLTLSAAGYGGAGGVRVVTGDGVDGYPPGAPYDRLIATAAMREVTPTWIRQIRPGGRVVVPYRNQYDGALVALAVDDDGATATGRVVGEAAFMWLRGQRPRGAESICEDDEIAAAQRSVTDLHPWWIAGDRDARFAIGQQVRSCSYRYEPDGEGDALWLLDFTSRSWAKIEHPDRNAETFTVLQYGPRRLFDLVERGFHWWDERGRPSVERWQFTVGPDGQRIELDE